MQKMILALMALVAGCMSTTAQEAGDGSRRPSVGVEYSGEVQTDFKSARMANLLQLQADIPLSRTVMFQAASLSALSTDRELDLLDLQGFSNIDTHERSIALALKVAGFTWQLNRHSLFAGIRRTDEDYFCSDGLGIFTNSSCGIFPTISANFDIGTFPCAALGIHYAYDQENLRLQASLYNGEGNYRFSGRKNIFRFCPQSDGVFALAQVEYRHRDSHYFLGASIHTEPTVKSTAWAYAEQCLSPRLMLLAAYGHAFGRDNSCDNFCALGGKYTVDRAEFGLFTDYARVQGLDEWTTELVCSIPLTGFLALQPALHVITTDGTTNCVALLRVNVSIGGR